MSVLTGPCCGPSARARRTRKIAEPRGVCGSRSRFPDFALLAGKSSRKVQALSILACKVISVEGMARVDFFYEEELTGFDDMGPPPLLSREDSDYYHQAGPVPLPDDVPVDFLVGKMNLRVILPKGQCVRMSVERRYFLPGTATRSNSVRPTVTTEMFFQQI